MIIPRIGQKLHFVGFIGLVNDIVYCVTGNLFKIKHGRYSGHHSNSTWKSCVSSNAIESLPSSNKRTNATCSP